ncbi:MAG: 50S ribosomal protein L9 [Cytophagales bacterium]|nr:50S ribosomal protein L9 [Cytophagales bacterium]
MEVILKEDIKGLGNKNEIVKVKPGYGENYLIPKGFAIIADAANKKVIAENVRQAAHKAAKIKQEAEGLAKKLDQLIIKIPAKVGEKGKIFGAVTALQISEALKAQGIAVDRKQISFNMPIKMLGTYEASLALHKEFIYPLKFTVVAE